MLMLHSRPRGGPNTYTVPLHVAQAYSTPRGRGTNIHLCPNTCALITPLPSVWGGTQPHTNGAPNIPLCPNTAVLSPPTPLPSAWGAQHLNGTSSCRRIVLIAMRTGHPTYLYAQIRLCSARLHHSCPHRGAQPINGTFSCRQAYSSPRGWGTQHTLSPNTGVVSRPTPLPPVWDTYHTYLSHRVAQASAIPHGRGTQPTIL